MAEMSTLGKGEERCADEEKIANFHQRKMNQLQLSFDLNVDI